jgi:hypothetical protein
MPSKYASVLYAARVLVTRDVAEEDVIIPTLAFAALSEDFPDLAEIRDAFASAQGDAQQWNTLELKFSNTFALFWPERYVDGVLFVRRHLLQMNSHYEPNTGVVKKIEAYIADRSVTAEEVARLYESALAQNKLDHARSDTGEFGWKIYCEAIRIAVRPEDPDIDPVRRHLVRSPEEQLPFPPPKLIEEVYRTLRGSGGKDKFEGYGSRALRGRSGRGESSSKGKTLIPSCTAWYLADRGRTNAEQRSKLTNLLKSEKIYQVDQDLESPHEALWTSVRRRSEAIEDVEKSILDSAQLRVGARPHDKYF